MGACKQDGLKNQQGGRVRWVPPTVLSHEHVLVDDRAAWIDMRKIRLHQFICQGLVRQDKGIPWDLVEPLFHIRPRDFIGRKVIDFIVLIIALLPEEKVQVRYVLADIDHPDISFNMAQRKILIY